jgi:hypothetical protein
MATISNPWGLKPQGYDAYGTGWTQANDPALAKTNAGALISGGQGQRDSSPPEPIQAQPAANYSTNFANPGRQGNDDNIVTTPAAQSPNDSLIQGLLAAMNNPNPYDSGPYMQNLDAARSQSLAAIAGARDRTNSNYATSNQNIGDMYNMGKNDTLAQSGALAQSNANLVGGVNGMYDNAINTLQGDRTKEMSDKADMMSRLGIQQAGLQDAGSSQTQAIQNASTRQQAANQQALNYGAADQTANTARANAFTSEGASRQADLRSQLSNVLGQLDSKELDVNNQYAQNAMSARNQAYQDNLSRISALYGMYDKAQTLDLNKQKSVLNSRLLTQFAKDGSGTGSGAGNSMTNIQDANNFVAANGGNPQDYNSAYTGSILDYANSPQASITPSASESALLNAMHAKNPSLDLNQALAYIRNASNSSKYNSPNPAGASQMAIVGQYLGQ